jgi:hypothetical protein
METTRLMLVSSIKIGDEDLEEVPMGTAPLMWVSSKKIVDEDVEKLSICTDLPPIFKRFNSSSVPKHR